MCCDAPLPAPAQGIKRDVGADDRTPSGSQLLEDACRRVLACHMLPSHGVGDSGGDTTATAGASASGAGGRSMGAAEALQAAEGGLRAADAPALQLPAPAPKERLADLQGLDAEWAMVQPCRRLERLAGKAVGIVVQADYDSV